jgi:hypothetical protein
VKRLAATAALLALAACGPASDSGGAKRSADAGKGSDGSSASAVGASTTPRRGLPVPEAIDRGVEYLVKSQNKDGSWGTPASNLWDIYAPAPGSFYTFNVAATALAAAGIMECGSKVPGADEALKRATDWLLAHHDVRRITTDALYNVWAHAYSLEFFCRCLAREKDEARRAAFKKAAETDIDRLKRYEYVDGGWGYYDFDLGAKTPGPGATSFTTATGLVALDMAAKQGVEVPRRLVDRGLKVIQRCNSGTGVYTYSLDLRYRMLMGINHIKGSLARTPACLLARDLWGDAQKPKEISVALTNLEREGRFLQIARKYPHPHETWYQNSGYFCFYGYYYASRLTGLLPENERAPHYASIAKYLTSVQEKDGSFWDYQLYNYHKPYGTGLVLLTLANCR